MPQPCSGAESVIPLPALQRERPPSDPFPVRAGSGKREKWAIRQANAAGLRPSARLILFRLVSHGALTGEAFPSRQTLHMETGLKPTAIKDAIAELVTAGIIAGRRRYDRRLGTAKRRSTAYTLGPDSGSNPATLGPESGRNLNGSESGPMMKGDQSDQRVRASEPAGSPARARVDDPGPAPALPTADQVAALPEVLRKIVERRFPAAAAGGGR